MSRPLNESEQYQLDILENRHEQLLSLLNAQEERLVALIYTLRLHDDRSSFRVVKARRAMHVIEEVRNLLVDVSIREIREGAQS